MVAGSNRKLSSPRHTIVEPVISGIENRFSSSEEIVAADYDFAAAAGRIRAVG